MPNLREHIKSVPPAQTALAVLLKAGCTENIILRHLYLYCGGDPKNAKAIKKEFRRGKKRMAALSEEIKGLPGQIKYANRLLEDIGIISHNFPDVGVMLDYAKLLSLVANSQLRDLADSRISGRDHHLVNLCEWVKRITSRQHYKEIAELVSATMSLYQPERETTFEAENIRKVVSHYGRLKMKTRWELEGWFSSNIPVTMKPPKPGTVK